MLKAWLDRAPSGAAAGLPAGFCAFSSYSPAPAASAGLPARFWAFSSSPLAVQLASSADSHRPWPTPSCRQLALPHLHRRRHLHATPHAAALLRLLHRAHTAPGLCPGQRQVLLRSGGARQRGPQRKLSEDHDRRRRGRGWQLPDAAQWVLLSSAAARGPLLARLRCPSPVSSPTTLSLAALPSPCPHVWPAEWLRVERRPGAGGGPPEAAVRPAVRVHVARAGWLLGGGHAGRGDGQVRSQGV